MLLLFLECTQDEKIDPKEFSATPAAINSSCVAETAEEAAQCNGVGIDSVAVTFPNGPIYRLFVSWSSGFQPLKGADIKVSYRSNGRLHEDVYFDEGGLSIPDFAIWPNFVGQAENIEVRISLIIGDQRLRTAYSEPYFIN